MWLDGLQWLSSWFRMTCEHIQSMSPSTPPPSGRWTVWWIQPAGGLSLSWVIVYLWWGMTLSITEGFLIFAKGICENLRKQTDTASLQMRAHVSVIQGQGHTDRHLSQSRVMEK